MANKKKGEGANSGGCKKLGPQWTPPSPDEVEEGQTLYHFSGVEYFQIRVTRLFHGGAWVMGTDMNGMGPFAVRLDQCMTESQYLSVNSEDLEQAS